MLSGDGDQYWPGPSLLGTLHVVLIEGLSAGRPLGTLILLAGELVLPSAAAELAKESSFEDLDGGVQACNSAQQVDCVVCRS